MTLLAIILWALLTMATAYAQPAPPPNSMTYTFSDATFVVNAETKTFAGYFVYDVATKVEWAAQIYLTSPSPEPYMGTCYFSNQVASADTIYANCSPSSQGITARFRFAENLSPLMANQLVEVYLPRYGVLPAAGFALPAGIPRP